MSKVMVDWDDLRDPNRKLDSATRNEVIHVIRAKPVAESFRSYCGDIFDYGELLILRQRLEDINCIECFEVARNRIEQPENYHRCGAAAPGGRKFKDGCWRHPVCETCPFPDCIAKEYECV